MRAAVMETVLGSPAVDGDAALFERARRIGFAGVEVVLTREELRGRGGGRLASLRRVRRDSGLEIPTLILGEHVDLGGLADADAAVAADATDDVRAAIACAAELGADVVLVPFFLRSEIVDDTALARGRDAFRTLCARAAAAGVTLCYEGTLPAGDVCRLADAVASDAFGCYFDLANPVADGLDTAVEARRLAGLIRRVHFKDARVRRGDCQPGLGRVDFAESARALVGIGYDGWLTLETPTAPPEVVARDLSFARSFFPALEPSMRWPRFGAFTHELGVGWDGLGGLCTELGLEAVQVSRALLEEWVAEPEAGRSDVPIAGLGAYRNLVAPDAGERRANLDFVARCLELAPLLGSSVVATHVGTRHPTAEWADWPDNRRERTWSLVIAAVEELLPVAVRSGSILALEASVKSALWHAGQVIELLDRFPTPHLQLVCDPYNYVSSHLLPAQERVTRDLLERFEHRFVVAHVKDVGPEGAEVSTPAAGTGVFEQRPYVEFLRARRPDLPLVLEHVTPEQIPTAMEAVTTVS
jgi:sugar phosphate isomerase/epimerase